MDIGDIFNDAIMRMDDDDIKSLIIDFQTILSDRQIARSKKICDDFIEEHAYKTDNKWTITDDSEPMFGEGWFVNEFSDDNKLYVKLNDDTTIATIRFKIGLEIGWNSRVYYIEKVGNPVECWWSCQKPPDNFNDDRNGYQVEEFDRYSMRDYHINRVINESD
jgi:hypothetical protein